MLGMDLWGPAKGMVRDLMLKAVRKIRQVRYFEFDGVTVTIPKHNLGKRKRDKPSEGDSPARHHRNHGYKLFGRGPQHTESTGALPNPEIDIADAQATQQTQQAGQSEANQTGATPIEEVISDEGTTQQAVNIQPEPKEGQSKNSAKRQRDHKLSVTKSKKARHSH